MKVLVDVGVKRDLICVKRDLVCVKRDLPASDAVEVLVDVGAAGLVLALERLLHLHRHPHTVLPRHKLLLD